MSPDVKPLVPAASPEMTFASLSMDVELSQALLNPSSPIPSAATPTVALSPLAQPKTLSPYLLLF
jgi:hypothetical protein